MCCVCLLGFYIINFTVQYGINPIKSIVFSFSRYLIIVVAVAVAVVVVSVDFFIHLNLYHNLNLILCRVD